MAGVEQTGGALCVWLELELDAEPIRGTLCLPDGDSRPFVGWLGLTSCLSALRLRREREEA